MTNQIRPTDDEMAAWVKEQNRGAPPFKSMDPQTKAVWYGIWARREAAKKSLTAAGGRGANSA